MLFFYISFWIFVILSLYHFILWLGRKIDFLLIGFSLYNAGLSIIILIRDIYPDLYVKYSNIIYDIGSYTGIFIMGAGIIFFTYLGFELKSRKELKIIFSIYILSIVLIIVRLFLEFLLKINFIKNIFLFPLLFLCLIYFILLFLRFIKEKLYYDIDKLIIVISTTILMPIIALYALLIIIELTSSPYFFYIVMIICSLLYSYSIIMKFNREYKELMDMKKLLEIKKSSDLTNKEKANIIDKFIKNINLSEKEIDVLKLALEGKSNKEISFELNIQSENTIKSRLYTIFRKCNVSSRIELFKIFNDLKE